MSNGIAPLFFIFAIYFGLILFFVTRYFSGAMGKNMKDRTGTDGQPYFFGKRKYGKYGMKYTVSAGVPVQNGFTFSICRRTLWHRFLAPLGFAQDLRTGDPLLDDTFYFMADDEEKLKTLLGASGFVAVLREAFETHQARDVECTWDKLWFNTGPVDFGGIQKDIIKSGLELKLNAGLGAQPEMDEQIYASQAARLAQEVGKLGTPDYRNLQSFPLSRAALLYRMIHAGFLLLALGLAATLLFRSEDIINMKDFLVRSASLAPIVILLWLMLLMTVFGRTSWFPQVCGSFVISGLAGLVLLTGFMVREADIDLDQAPPEVKSLQLQSKSCSLHCTTGGKHAQTSNYRLTDSQCSVAAAGRTIDNYRADDYRCQHSARINYTLYFPWPTERTDRKTGAYKLETQAESYEQAHQGEAFAFPLHKGYLGLAWIRKGDVRAE